MQASRWSPAGTWGETQSEGWWARSRCFCLTLAGVVSSHALGGQYFGSVQAPQLIRQGPPTLGRV